MELLKKSKLPEHRYQNKWMAPQYKEISDLIAFYNFIS